MERLGSFGAKAALFKAHQRSRSYLGRRGIARCLRLRLRPVGHAHCVKHLDPNNGPDWSTAHCPPDPRTRCVFRTLKSLAQVDAEL